MPRGSRLLASEMHSSRAMQIDSEDNDWMNQTREMFETRETLELSIVDLVLAATELTEDEMEVSDFVEEAILSGRVLVQAAA